MGNAVLGTFGSACLGLVWGWLAGSLTLYARPRVRTLLALLFATLAFIAQVMFFLDWRRLLFFLGAALFALFLHAVWRRALRLRASGGSSH